MSLKEEVFATYRKNIDEHRELNRIGALRMKNTLDHSPIGYNGMTDKTVHVPKVYDEDDIALFEDIVATSHRIFEKVIREYREHADYRALFPFSEELSELICLPNRYGSLLPMARFDIFYHEDTKEFRFCEINTDGTAAMLRDLEMRKALIHDPAHREVERTFELASFELFDTWVETFLCLYQNYPKKVAKPTVAIADILENATLGDFEEFARRFRAAGVDCEICDLRELTYRDHKLYGPSGRPVDAIYRRAVTADVMAYYDDVTDFLDAVRNDDVFLAGDFGTQCIHTKWLFYVLHLPRTKQFLTEDEVAFVEAHVPKTVAFTEEYIALDEVQMHKDRYILKPMDAYASKGIYASGREFSQEKWEETTAELYGMPGLICQEYCEQYLTENIDFAWGDGEWHPYMNMTGLYAYDGKFAGFLMRMACEEKIIVAHGNERTAPVFVVKGKKDE